MQAAAVPGPGEAPELVERERPSPGPEEVRIAVEACGVCGRDSAVTEGGATAYPRVPGHEIAGRVDAAGERVSEWSAGDRVAVGWHGGHCFACEPCRRGPFVTCEDHRVTGLHRDGGYAEYSLARREALAAVPPDLAFVHAGPLVCAGTTGFNALRNSDARAGDLVAVQGIGGVGHLAVAFAAVMGFRTVALSRSPGKREVALAMGADEFVDTSEADPADALQSMGGADAVLATPPSAAAVESVVGSLAPEGEVIVVGAPAEPARLDLARMLDGRWSVAGWSCGHARDEQDALEVAARVGIEPRVVRYPLEEAGDALAALTDGSARFRGVLEP